MVRTAARSFPTTLSIALRGSGLLLVALGCATTPANGSSDTEGSGTLRATSAGLGLLRLTSAPGDELWPAASADGAHLLFAAGDGKDASTLVRLDLAAGGQQAPATPTGKWSGFPAWLPDGSGFLYVGDELGGLSLMRRASAGEAAPAVVVPGSAAPSPRQPRVSPDGKWVCFTTLVHDVPTLALAGIDGSPLRLLGEGDAPAWSPDGSQLAFQRWVNGASQVFTMSPTGAGNPTQLTWG